jgi:hypothetical protein
VPSGLCRVNLLQGLCSCVLSSCPSHLNCLTLISFTTSGSLHPSAESRHLTAGLPTRRVPSGLCGVNLLQGLCSCVLSSCPSHLNCGRKS